LVLNEPVTREQIHDEVDVALVFEEEAHPLVRLVVELSAIDVRSNLLDHSVKVVAKVSEFSGCGLQLLLELVDCRLAGNKVFGRHLDQPPNAQARGRAAARNAFLPSSAPAEGLPVPMPTCIAT
jgi:hypothetical protein